MEASTESKVVFPEVMQYQKETYVKPEYKLSRVLQQTGGQSVTGIGTGAGQDSIFQIPATRCFNLSKSHLYFKITPTATATANTLNWAFIDAVTPIKEIQISTTGGVMVCDLQEVPNYTKVVSKPESKLEHYLQYDNHQDLTISAESTGRYFARSNATCATNTRTLLNPFSMRFNATNSNINWTEPKYMEPGTVNGVNPVYNVAIPLSHFKNTLMSLDRDLIFNEILNFRILWNNSNRVYTTSTLITDPTNGPVAFAGTYDITSLGLYLAVEKNQEIINILQAKIASGGLQVLYPYVYSYKNNPGSGSAHSLSLKWSRGLGLSLLKIYHSAFNTAETLNTAYDHDNKGVAVGSKVNTFYTMVDQERTTEYDLSTATFDDYLQLLPKIKGSVIQSADMFYHNWFWMEDFTGFKDKTSEPALKDNLITGLSLERERKWDWYATQVNAGTATSYYYYTFAVLQRLLIIDSSGVRVT